jgi:hypothetical protein
MSLEFIRHLNESLYAVPTELVLHKLAQMLLHTYSSYVFPDANKAFHYTAQGNDKLQSESLMYKTAFYYGSSPCLRTGPCYR